MCGRLKSRLGHGLAAQPSGANGLCGPLQRTRRRGHHVQTARGTTRWRARWRLGSGSTVARCCQRSRGGHSEGAGQGGVGRGAPERWVDGEVAQIASGGGVQRRRVAPVVIDVRGGILQHRCGKGERDLSPIWEWWSLEGAHQRGGRQMRRSAKSDVRERPPVAGGGGIGVEMMGREAALERGRRRGVGDERVGERFGHVRTARSARRQRG
jgi:hypothetical protein